MLATSQHIYTGGFNMGLGADGWALLLVPTLLGVATMVVYGFWDKITGKEYYVDDDILAYDEDLIKQQEGGA